MLSKAISVVIVVGMSILMAAVIIHGATLDLKYPKKRSPKER